MRGDLFPLREWLVPKRFYLNLTVALPPNTIFTLKSIETTDYRQLIVWQKSIDFADAIYDATERFPDKERFGLCTARTYVQSNATSRRFDRQQHSGRICPA